MRQDAWLAGVFSDHEMPIVSDLLDHMLKLDAPKKRFKAMNERAVEWLLQRGIPSGEIAWQRLHPLEHRSSG